MKKEIKHIKMFTAFVKCPPMWYLNPNPYSINSADSVAQKLNEMEELNGILFAWSDESNEFIPVDIRNDHLKIQDFKYIIANTL
jgi:hypothetical protein